MKKNAVVFFWVFALILFSGCVDSKIENMTLANIEHQIHCGEYLGEVPVYVIDFVYDTYEYKSFHPVYKQSDGSYTIDYLGNDYVLSRLDDSIVLPGCEYTKVNWKFNFDCFIKEIPN